MSYEVVNFVALVWYVLPEHNFDTVSWMLWRNKLDALPSSVIGRRTVCLSDGNAISTNEYEFSSMRQILIPIL